MSQVKPAAQKSCAVCGRNLLIGERSNPYIGPGGTEVLVCELCKPRAEQAGWLRPEEAVVAHDVGGRRRRRRRSGGELLGGLRARVERASESIGGQLDEGDAEPEDAGASERSEGRRGSRSVSRAPSSRRRREPVADEDQPAPMPMRSTAGPDVVESLAAFNRGENRRTVSGLSKSLGEPLATAIAIRTASGDTGARITVAWELAWYQWEVGPGARGPEVREIARGETIDQLHAADRNWNLDVSSDGTLARRPVGGPEPIGESE